MLSNNMCDLIIKQAYDDVAVEKTAKARWAKELEKGNLQNAGLSSHERQGLESQMGFRRARMQDYLGRKEEAEAFNKPIQNVHSRRGQGDMRSVRSMIRENPTRTAIKALGNRETPDYTNYRDVEPRYGRGTLDMHDEFFGGKYNVRRTSDSTRLAELRPKYQKPMKAVESAGAPSPQQLVKPVGHVDWGSVRPVAPKPLDAGSSLQSIGQRFDALSTEQKHVLHKPSVVSTPKAVGEVSRVGKGLLGAGAAGLSLVGIAALAAKANKAKRVAAPVSKLKKYAPYAAGGLGVAGAGYLMTRGDQ